MILSIFYVMLKMPLIKYVLEFNQNLKFIHPNIEFLNVTGKSYRIKDLIPDELNTSDED